ncbi:MAG TPA: DUF192 domain-containing protein [Candidatus Andersenbacteria bacterium]|nr:DUF192 domain-containing protein [Candidatus Andersenbacteria bacterium]
MKAIIIATAACVILAVSLFAYQLVYQHDQCSTGHMAVLDTPNQALLVSIAKTPQEQAKGLGGCPMLAKNTGMYFPFSTSAPQTFWMKNMIIPIDIVWISQGKVVGITSQVPFPHRGSDDASLVLYKSPQDVDAVLEIGSGMAQAYGLQDGSKVVLVSSP